MFLSPLFQSKTNHQLRIFFVGHEPKRYAWQEAKEDILRITGEDREQAMLVVLASTSKDTGFGTMKVPVFQSAIHADGTFYEGDEPTAFMYQTADCPFLIVQDDETGKIAMGHCGKPAMRGTKGSCGNMVTTVLSQFRDVDPVHLSAYIMAGICGTCYTHEQDLSHVEPFYNRIDHGEDRALGELNLIKRIKHELRFRGLPESNIEIDWRCTKETPELASHRGSNPERNTIVVLVN